MDLGTRFGSIGPRSENPPHRPHLLPVFLEVEGAHLGFHSHLGTLGWTQQNGNGLPFNSPYTKQHHTTLPQSISFTPILGYSSPLQHSKSIAHEPQRYLTAKGKNLLLPNSLAASPAHHTTLPVSCWLTSNTPVNEANYHPSSLVSCRQDGSDRRGYRLDGYARFE